MSFKPGADSHMVRESKERRDDLWCETADEDFIYWRERLHKRRLCMKCAGKKTIFGAYL